MLSRFNWLPHILPLVSWAAVAVAGAACSPSLSQPAVSGASEPGPPVAALRAHLVHSPNGARQDEYYWMRDDQREKPELLAHLAAENAHRDTVLAPVRQLQDSVFDELVGRIKKDDTGVPFFDRGYFYYHRFVEGGEYPLVARKKGSLKASEEILLDGNSLARPHEFFQLGVWEISPGGERLAYAEDTVGRRQYTLRFKDLKTGEVLPDAIPNLSPQIAWADDKTVFYIEKDPITLLGNTVKRHTLGEPVSQDVAVYIEKDASYYLGVGNSGDHKFVVIHAGSTVADETRFLSTSTPLAGFSVLAPRERGHEYSADHQGSQWVIRTNWLAKDFRIMSCSNDAVARGKAGWEEVIPAESQVHLSSMSLFDDFLVLEERRGGLSKIRIHTWETGESSYVPTEEKVYSASVGMNAEQGSEVLRYHYTSLKTPEATFDLNMKTGARTLLKQQEVLGDFDPARYKTWRMWATARDGARVPVSLVSKVGVAQDGTAPLYQYGYGSYGHSLEPSFRSGVLSLLDRGFVYAIAHVRGGQEMGRQWYEDGKLLNKRNTFTDFIDVTEFLVSEKVVDPKRLVAAGGSAGGLLMGAVVNMRPELYRAVVAHVPFVDVVTTMLDESIPLTTNEFDEWGNPKEKVYYDYMLSYSPYDNVRAQHYPALLVMTGLWDSQVQYFEPAKWVARLRANNTSEHPIVFSVNLQAGHGGASGRFRRQRETAMEYAFVLQQLGLSAGKE